MDTKNQENYLKKYDGKSLEKLQSRTIFSDPSYLYVFKKTEKIVIAIYLITNLISDIEPIKWQIRKISSGLMSDILTLKRLPPVQLKQAITNLTITISEIISLTKVASFSEHISSMNYSVVQKELVLLMDILQNMHFETISNGVQALPQDFLNVPTPVSARSSSGNNHLAQTFASKGQYKTPFFIKDNQIQQVSKDNLKDIKNDRHEKILQLLKAGKPLGIKDFAGEIKDCSEKTLQRELLSMVGNGVLKKIGERRWSLYSLT
jgi:hypothetical protein